MNHDEKSRCFQHIFRLKYGKKPSCPTLHRLVVQCHTTSKLEDESEVVAGKCLISGTGIPSAPSDSSIMKGSYLCLSENSVSPMPIDYHHVPYSNGISWRVTEFFHFFQTHNTINFHRI